MSTEREAVGGEGGDGGGEILDELLFINSFEM